MKNLFTIIIPHKNIPDLLVKCINTIPNDLEVIVVDDNSNAETILSLSGINKPNVKVIYSKENKGAGCARNIGMKHATGKWLLFADADDYYHKDAFVFFYEYINSDYDIIHFNQEGRFLNTDVYSDRCKQFSYIIDNYIDNPSYENLDHIKYGMHTPYVKMIRKKLVDDNNILFDESIGSNDVMFSTLIGHHANKILVDKRIAYFVNVRTGSLTKTRSKENAYSRFLVWLNYNKFMKQIDKPHLQVLLLSRVFQAYIYFGFKEFCSYLKLVKENKVNLFSKSYLVIFSFFNYLRSIFKNDKFLIKK